MKSSIRTFSEAWRRPVGLALAVVAVVVGLVVSPRPASAFFETRLIALTESKDFYPPDIPTTIISYTMNLQAGETIFVRDRLVIANSSTEGAEVGNIIECYGPDGLVASFPSFDSGTNHPGSAAGVIVLAGSLLFTAQVSGTHHCDARAETSDGPRTSYHMTAVVGGFGTGHTELVVSNFDEVGSHWWQNQTCTSNGTIEVDGMVIRDPNCVFLGPSPLPSRFTIFEGAPYPGPAPYLWTAASGATTAEVWANAQLTSCTSGSSSCSAGPHGGTDHAKFRAHLEFNQLWPWGEVCKANSTPDTTYTISNTVHHLPIQWALSGLQISPNCGGSRQFAVRLPMTWLEGNPVKIDAGSFIGYHSATNATALNRNVALTTTVPDVIGLSPTAAQGALQAAGLTVGTVTSVPSLAPAGNVLSQNSPAETVEPTGSPVDLVESYNPLVLIPPHRTGNLRRPS